MITKIVSNPQNNISFLINRILEIFGNKKLFERSIEFVALEFESHTSNTRLAELLYLYRGLARNIHSKQVLLSCSD